MAARSSVPRTKQRSEDLVDVDQIKRLISGLDEIVFLWPPGDHAFVGNEAVPAERVRMFERIAAQRSGRR